MESGKSLFPQTGLKTEVVSRELRNKLQDDLTFSSGHILGSMCSLPHPYAAEIFAQELEKNLGDPGLHPALAELEKDTIQLIGSLLSNPQAVGAVVSGGTEANLLAMWTAKNRSRPDRREVVLPETAHFSFDKAASLMDLELRKIKTDAQNRVDIRDFASAIGPKTMAMVGIAGTTGLGAVDPLPQLSDLALQHDLYFHVDAAFGGFVLPFLKEAGYAEDDIPFDFNLPGVSSITIDPHKMGRAPIPAGCILYRDDEIAGHSATDVTYLAGGKTRQRTIVGTRPGAATASVWAILHHLGREGYVNLVAEAMQKTNWLKDEIEKIDGIQSVIEPVINVLGIRPVQGSAEELADHLRNRGYALSLFPGFLRITLMPHLSESQLTSFLKILSEELHV